jgi:hypothetical protein
MISTRFQRTIRVLLPAIAVTALAFVVTAGRPVEAAGLRNCVDVTGHAASRVACYEIVWVDGVQLKMTFFAGGTAFPGGTPSDNLGRFYLVAPQTGTSQAELPFPHDHVAPAVPRQNGGDYTVHLRGVFVFCADGIASNQCAPGTTPTPFGTPFARTVNGQPLTSAGAIQSAVDAGLVTIVDSGGTVIGTLGRGQ